jgi:hypothetical protein
MAGNDELRNALKILSRLFFRPVRRAGSEGLKMKSAISQDVAAITAGVAETVLQENRLDGAFENIVIERLGPSIFARLLWRFVLAAGRDGEEHRR